MTRVVWLVWNKPKTECVGFVDKDDAEQAAGIKRLSNPCSTLALVWREGHADECMGDQPPAGEREMFELERVEFPGMEQGE